MHKELFDHIYETVARKESTYDGVYYTCVKTTRIFCRPSCRARTPFPQNILFATSVQEAIDAGFRPCKRCRPELPGRQTPDERLAAEVNRLLKQGINGPITLQEIADMLAISPFHLQRLYKRVTGSTPAVYLQELRLAEAKIRLESGDDAGTIAAVAKAVGYRSHSHFTAWFSQETGMTPSEYRNVHKERGRQG
ncbi:AraC family transcriptional regulator [Paenibacillus yonginensis]|uniref:AraC family transcriptional regulator n=1 Tax=Paenibacillus yonginensis TaxID=1462996 RepID=A0A1B1MYY2_9BACL|nr:Ada metal-binding domain-containing protein [Paenibacillus yonginensis]ANS74376.1 AraC family transcriptional regulator [Paenibacillus yonginensis]